MYLEKVKKQTQMLEIGVSELRAWSAAEGKATKVQKEELKFISPIHAIKLTNNSHIKVDEFVSLTVRKVSKCFSSKIKVLI